MKLIGFSIWERRTTAGRNVTFPARQYSVNGERRSFALLRPVVETDALNAVRDLKGAWAGRQAASNRSRARGRSVSPPGAAVHDACLDVTRARIAAP
jgi:hypothetical protein